MNKIIEKFYRDNDIPPVLIKQKLSAFEQNPDIASEFEYWIRNGTYMTDGAVCVEGYNAKRLADTSVFLNGEGAFMLLIALREDSKKALRQIDKGYDMK